MSRPQVLAVIGIAVVTMGGCGLDPVRRAPEISVALAASSSLPPSLDLELPREGSGTAVDDRVTQVFPVARDRPLEAPTEILRRDNHMVAPDSQRVESSPVDIWDRLRRGFAMPPLNTAAAEQFARQFASTGFLNKTEARARRYLFYFLEEIERRGLPTELALLPFVESSMNPHARSRVGAVGAWQFMPATGRRFDMRVSHLVDDRKSVSESTRGAIDYLRTLYAQFGDWHLALASYNWGEQNVARARERNRSRRRADDYLSLSMPRETRNYVPQLEGLKLLILDPDRYGAKLPAILNEPYFREVPIRADMDVDSAVRLAGIDNSEFFALNPSVRPPLVIAAATPRLLLPQEAAERFDARLSAHVGPLASWTVVRLEPDARIETLAAKSGISLGQLRRVNGIPPQMRPVAGSSLIVPKLRGSADRQVSGELVESAHLTLRPELTRIVVTVHRKETLSRIANRLGVKTADLVRWNHGLSPKTRLKTGQRIVAYVHVNAARPRRERSSLGRSGGDR